MNRLLCRIFGHRYALLREITDDMRELECKRCGQQFAMHDGLKTIVPLDDEIKEAGNDILHYRRKNIERLYGGHAHV